MQYLKDAWYQAAWSHEVAAGVMFDRRILGEPVLLVRSMDNTLTALSNVCPHRFAPLSKGRFGDDRITCRYHGLAFDFSGRCVDNPNGPIPRASRLRHYPVMERGGAIFIWPGDPRKADPDRLLPLDFLEAAPEKGRIVGVIPIQADYQLMSDNLMDLSHINHLHAGSLGAVLQGAKPVTTEYEDRLEMRYEKKGAIAAFPLGLGIQTGDRVDVHVTMTWRSPALVVARLAQVPAGRAWSEEDVRSTLHSVTPETDSTCHYFWMNVRHFALDDSDYARGIAETIRSVFVNEDKPMIESVQLNMSGREFWSLRPLLLSSDKGAVLARRKLEKLIEAETAAAGA